MKRLVFYFAIIILSVLPAECLAGWSGVFRGATRVMKTAGRYTLKRSPAGRVPDCIDELCVHPLFVRANTRRDARFVEALSQSVNGDFERRLAGMKKLQRPTSFTFQGQTHQGWFVGRGGFGDVFLSEDGKTVFKYPRLKNRKYGWEGSLRMARRETALLDALEEAGFPVVRSQYDCELAAFHKPYIRGFNADELPDFVMDKGRRITPTVDFTNELFAAYRGLGLDVQHFHKRKLSQWLYERGIDYDAISVLPQSDFVERNVRLWPTSGIPETHGSPGLGLIILDP